MYTARLLFLQLKSVPAMSSVIMYYHFLSMEMGGTSHRLNRKYYDNPHISVKITVFQQGINCHGLLLYSDNSET